MVLMILNGHCLWAQYHIGLSAGPNLSWQRFEDSDYNSFHQSKPGVGYQIGFLFLYRANDHLGLSVEAQYESKASKVKSSANDYTEKVSRYRYLDFPILFRYFFTSRYMQWYLGAGPELNYWLGGTGRFEVYDPSRDVINSYSYTIHFGDDNVETDKMNVTEANRLQVSFSFAAGFLMEIGENQLIGGDIRFSLGHTYMGIMNGGQIPQLGLTDNFESTLNVVELSAVYLFQLGRRVGGK